MMENFINFQYNEKKFDDDKTQKDLISGSGIYQFSASDSSLVIKRKISVNTNNINWWTDCRNDLYAFGNGDTWYSDVTGTNRSGTVYVDYKYSSFIVVRAESDPFAVC